jgi:hypothetical protein
MIRGNTGITGNAALLRYAECKSNFAIAIALGAEIRYFPLLAIRHFLYTSICGTPVNRYQVIPSDSYVLGNAKAPNFERKNKAHQRKSPVGLNCRSKY